MSVVLRKQGGRQQLSTQKQLFSSILIDGSVQPADDLCLDWSSKPQCTTGFGFVVEVCYFLTTGISNGSSVLVGFCLVSSMIFFILGLISVASFFYPSSMAWCAVFVDIGNFLEPEYIRFKVAELDHLYFLRHADWTRLSRAFLRRNIPLGVLIQFTFGR